MRKIALSYRRADSSASAGRIQEHLSNHFGADEVFMDIDAIPYGEDFREYIDEALKHAVAMVLIIGPKWLGTRRRGAYRIQEATDPVRIEVETAMRLELRIVPVLVEGATMPQPSDLPESLSKLPFINAATVDSGRDFRIHMERVIRALEIVLERAPAPPVEPQPAAPRPAPQPAAPEPERLSAQAVAKPTSTAHDATIANRITGAWWITLVRALSSLVTGAFLVANVARMHAPASLAEFSSAVLVLQVVTLGAMIVVSRGVRVAQIAFGAELLLDLLEIVPMRIAATVVLNGARIAAEALAGTALGRHARAEYARAIVLPIVYVISALTVVTASFNSSMAVYYANAASTIGYGLGFGVLAIVLFLSRKRPAA